MMIADARDPGVGDIRVGRARPRNRDWLFRDLACRFGARKVFTIEPDEIIHLARRLAPKIEPSAFKQIEQSTQHLRNLLAHTSMDWLALSRSVQENLFFSKMLAERERAKQGPHAPDDRAATGNEDA